MAEQVPYGVAEGLISKLASRAFREIGSIYGVMDDLENLKQTLESIKIVLSDAELRQGQDSVIEHWIRRFKQVLYGADDLLDDLLIRDLRAKARGAGKFTNKVRQFFSLSDNPIVFRAKLVRKIDEIQRKFDDVTRDMSRFNLNPSSVINVKQNESAWRETCSYVLQSEIIGREDDKHNILEFLKQTHPNQNVSFVAVVGMGGLGKTALAQLVFNAAQEQKLFQKYIWVCVSDDFEVKTILKKMLKKEGDDTLEVLQQMLRQELNGQKYMLVLDDVWNEDHLKWGDLRTHLMCGGQGSKVLITTRSTLVSQTMGVNEPYVLKGLTDGQSWTLLKNLTFGEDSSRRSSKFQTIGEKIAKKCEGVPLAIKTIGGFLATRTEDTDQWSSVLNGDIWRLCKEQHSIMPVLKLSYQNLPVELRQCFAYCCLYPKDSRIYKDELIQLWMAQGYLPSSIELQSMENVGNEYVKILFMRSFFQEASKDICDDDIESFKMHDLMHDLALSIAGNDCYLDTEGKRIVGDSKHVSFETGTVCSLDTFDASKLRTIIFSSEAAKSMIDHTLIQNFRCLRSLNLSRSSITQLPKSIDKAKHLKFLDLSGCGQLTSLPKSFGLGKLTSLHYLSNFVVGDNEKGTGGNLGELKDLNNIGGELTISKLGSVKDVASISHETNLISKKYIQALNLFWGQGYYSNDCEIKNGDSLMLLDSLCPHNNLRSLSVSGFPGVKFSDWLISLNKIVSIKFYNLPNCEHLPPLERLPCLKKLEIEEIEKLERIGDDKAGNENEIHVSVPPFSCLSSLRIRDCPKLTYIPPFPHVQELGLASCSAKVILETCMVKHDTSSFSPLSSLKTLHLYEVTEIEAMAEDWMKNLTSLQRLFLQGSSTVEVVLRQMQHLPSQLED
ncbi:hypothetical protein PIB30_023761 [Stylosanthes scabra]|uniref:Uncharacterized protein n=1 Tax=Stylosanthes scabra TaxID=79078 RepID=A0ABU6X734_9FABA|nr:hypothetical protein [Stylosanthes scabra]